MVKICLNPTCGKKFKANHGKQKYCSDNCKVAHHRAKGEIDAVIARTIIPPTPMKKSLEDPNVDLGKRFSDICKLKKVSPEDALVWFEENYSKLPSFLKKPKQDAGKKEQPAVRGGSAYLEARRKMKGGGV